jgi:hypothetical protein
MYITYRANKALFRKTFPVIIALPVSYLLDAKVALFS